MCQRCDRDLVPQLVKLHKAGQNLRVVSPALCVFTIGFAATSVWEVGPMLYASISFLLNILLIAWGIALLIWCHEFAKGARIAKKIPHTMDDLEESIARKVIQRIQEEDL